MPQLLDLGNGDTMLVVNGDSRQDDLEEYSQEPQRPFNQPSSSNGNQPNQPVPEGTTPESPATQGQESSNNVVPSST